MMSEFLFDNYIFQKFYFTAASQGGIFQNCHNLTKFYWHQTT